MAQQPSPARLRSARLEAHGLRSGLPSVVEAVRRLGAVQAQDLTAAKWVLGVRVPGSVAADVDDALESRSIVRSWPMRGTLHLLPAEMLRPVVAITGPREIQRAALRRTQLELDDATLRAARTVAERVLAGGESRSREQLQAAWESAGIVTAGQRGYHLIWWLANESVLSWGPVDGRAQRLVLLDDWAPSEGPTPERDETLATLFIAYVRGHGPVTVRDFAWWSGLPLGEARRARAAAGRAVTAFDEERLVASDAGWPADPGARTPRAAGAIALAGFDEYFLGYADREVVCDPVFAPRVVPGGNGVFQATLVDRGRIVGTWKRGVGRAASSVVVQEFEPGTVDPAAFEPSLRAWARFWGRELDSIEVA